MGLTGSKKGQILSNGVRIHGRAEQQKQRLLLITLFSIKTNYSMQNTRMTKMILPPGKG